MKIVTLFDLQLQVLSMDKLITVIRYQRNIELNSSLYRTHYLQNTLFYNCLFYFISPYAKLWS